MELTGPVNYIYGMTLQPDVKIADVTDGTCLSYGNALTAGEPYRDWFTGLFIAEDIGLRHAAVELKWSDRPKGWRRGWSDPSEGTSITILISGSMKLTFAGAGEGDVLLKSRGDYVMWCPETRHDCVALEDCTVLTVRWDEGQ